MTRTVLSSDTWPGDAWVVFSGESDIWWLRLLKKGFRHCFVVARDEKSWILIDPLSPHLDVSVLPFPSHFDLPDWLRQQQDLKVIPARVKRQFDKSAPANWFSCVEVIKRFLGIHARRIMTPWQLYCFLTKENLAHG